MRLLVSLLVWVLKDPPQENGAALLETPGLMEMVAKKRIQVTDHVTSADITAQTLAQIIFEEEKISPRVGADVLRKIIVSRSPVK